MKFRFPAIIFYTDKLPEGTGGCATAFIIRIRPKYRDNDEGIHQHELFHVRHWYAFTFLSLAVLAAVSFFFTALTWAPLPAALAVFPLLYLIPQFRQWEEIAAYKVQLKYPPATTADRDRYAALYAKYISDDYGLNISQEEALKKMT